MMHKFSALQSFSLANLILAVLTGVAVAQTQSEDDVDEDKPDFGELVDLAEERPEVRDLMDFHGGPDADLYQRVRREWPGLCVRPLAS